MPETPSSPERQHHLERVIADYLHALEAGQAPDHAALLKQYPELADDLGSFFRNRDAMERMAEPIKRALPPMPETIGPSKATGTGTFVRYFGDYELVEEIARGGMGVVFRARQVSLNRIVAVKMILAGQLASSGDVQRFKIEAEAAAGLDHPNIVPIYEVGEHEGQHYFSMKLVEGGSLGQLMASLKWPLRTRDVTKKAAELMVTLARAVHHAHQRGILHRDLKPANILLDAAGQPHITDFGLAKRVTGAKELTQSGAMVGTPAYMAPEQVRAEKRLTTAVDVYGLGAMLYEMLTSRPPFQAATPFDTLTQVLERDPAPLRKLRPDLDQDLETICLKSMHKQPDWRYASAAALADDVQRWLQGEPILGRRAGRMERASKWVRRNKGLSTGLAAAVLALLIGTAVSTWLAVKAVEQASIAKEKEQAAIDQEREAKKQARIATENEDKANKAAVEKDNVLNDLKYNAAMDHILLSQVAFDGNNVQLARERLEQVPADLRRWEWNYLKRQYDGGIFTLYGHTGQVKSVAFSPDGIRMATGSAGVAKVWDARTGMPLFDVSGYRSWVACAFSPDSQRLATGGDQTAKIWDAHSGKHLLDLKGHSALISSVAFSPDGTRLATGSFDGSARIWDAHTGMSLYEIAGLKSRPGLRPLQGQDPNGPLFKERMPNVRTTVAYSPDGTSLVVAHNTIKIWDARTGTHLLDVKSPGMSALLSMTAVAFSPDGTRLVTVSADTVKVWDARTGASLLHVKRDTEPVTSVAFSPDGKRLAIGCGTHFLSASALGTAKILDARSGDVLRVLRGHSAQVESVAFSPDGTRLITGSSDQTAKVWDARTGTPVLQFKAPTDLVVSVALSGDGTRLATGGGAKDHTVRVWDAHSGALLHVLKGHNTLVYSVAFSPDGSRLVSSSYKTAKIWDARAGKLVHDLNGHTSSVYSVAYSPNGTCVATAGDKTARIWDVRTGEPLSVHKEDGEFVSKVAFSPDGTLLAIGTGTNGGAEARDPVVRVREVRTGALQLELKGHTGTVYGLAFSPDGTRLVSGSGDATAIVWDARDGTPLLTLKGHTNTVKSVSFDHAATRLVTASSDETVKVWDVRTGTPLLEIKGRTGSVRDAFFSPDGTRLVSAGQDNAVKIWDAHAGPPAIELKGHSGRIYKVAFNPDGTRLVSGNFDKTATIWDARVGTALLTLKGHSAPVWCVSFSSDGTRVVTASFDKAPKIWDARTGAHPADLKGHTEAVSAVAFSPDGSRVATGGMDRTAIIWDAQTGAILRELKGHGSPIFSVAFASDGSRLIITRWDSTANAWDVSIWDAKTGQPLPEQTQGFVLNLGTTSPDGRYFANLMGDRVRIIDQRLSSEELAYRRFWSKPRPDLHREEYFSAVKENDAFAANFHRDRFLAYLKQAVAADPNNVQAHVDLAAGLQETKGLDSAITEYRRAIELDPKHVELHKKLALALSEKEDWDGAFAAYSDIVALDPNDWEGVNFFSGSMDLFAKGPHRPYAAARLSAAIFAANPKMADSMTSQYRYNAACFAALAAAGKGNDADKLDEKERSRWRKQALDWLRADLTAYPKQLESGQTAARKLVTQRLNFWKNDSDLVGIRDEQVVSKLPAEEREACRKLWADVEELLKKAS